MTYFFEEIFKQEKDKLKLKETKENIYSNSIDDILASIITKDGKSKVYFYTKNQLGSITSLTDEKGKVVEEYKYDVLGKAYIRNGKSENWREFSESKINNTNLFTGREFDREIGLSYYRARYYSAEFGRFISRDPIGQIDDINLYSYVGNNSVNLVDPSGLEKALMVINMAYDLFITKELEYTLMNDTSDYINKYFLNGAGLAYDAQIMTFFMLDTVEGESNIKMREDFGQYATNRIDTTDVIDAFGHPIGGEINYKGTKIYLSDIGNMLFGFNASNIGYNQNFMKTGQYTETLLKFGGDINATIKNEEDDSVLINAGYQLGGQNLTKENFINILVQASREAENIRLNQK